MQGVPPPPTFQVHHVSEEPEFEIMYFPLLTFSHLSLSSDPKAIPFPYPYSRGTFGPFFFSFDLSPLRFFVEIYLT